MMPHARNFAKGSIQVRDRCRIDAHDFGDILHRVRRKFLHKLKEVLVDDARSPMKQKLGRVRRLISLEVGAHQFDGAQCVGAGVDAENAAMTAYNLQLPDKTHQT